MSEIRQLSQDEKDYFFGLDVPDMREPKKPSSTIARLGFAKGGIRGDTATESGDWIGTLAVEFKNQQGQTPAVYKYAGVPLKVFEALLEADSVGSAHAMLIKMRPYPFKKMLAVEL